MTRPLRSTQLDGLAELLAKLSASLTDGGDGRIQLQRMRDHANARGFPASTMGGSVTGTRASSSTEVAALENDPTLVDYATVTRLLGRMMADARKVTDLLDSYGRQKVTVCPRCSVVIPAGRVRCPQCRQHPDSRICSNLSCLKVLKPGEKLLTGTDDVERCESCHRFWRRNRRDRTADDMRGAA